MTLCLLLISIVFIACDEPESIEATVPTSLHGTYEGMRAFSEARDGDPHFIGNGIEQAFGLDYDDLECKSCHSMLSFTEPDDKVCNNCHKSLVDYSVGDLTCVQCHGRQLLEVAMGVTDLHLWKRSTNECVKCHTKREMHGDEKGITDPYRSLSDPEARDTKCLSCHNEADLSQANHTTHKDTLDCSACHLKSVVTCYNCHFDTYMETGKDKSVSPIKNWVFLVNDEKGKVRAGNFQSVIYQNKKFVVFAPYHSHSVTKNARSCSECHDNEAIQELKANDKITVAKWNESTAKLVTKQGIIPVVDGKMELEFLNYDSDSKSWSSAGTTADTTQYGYCTPLTEEQIAKLKQKK